MGFLPNDGLTMAHVPGLPAAVAQLAAVIYQPGTVGMELKRLVGLVHSMAAGCRYCQGHTRYGATRAGVDPERLESLWDYEQAECFDQAERAALRLAQAAGQAPSAVEDRHFDDLRAHYNDTQIAEIVAVIALFGLLNRWNDTVGTELEI